jgi:dephospho-CoA kinase
MTIVIGLTGGIGSGKSTISRYLEELGAEVIDADKVGHETLKPGTAAWRDVVNAFGQNVVAPSGEIDRKKLAQIVFEDAGAREKLNRIMWSRIWEMITARIDEFRKLNTDVVVVEAFGLIEAGWGQLVDQVWVTVASEKAVLERLKKQRKMSEADILSRIRSQLPGEERTRCADVVIQNEGDPDEVKSAVRKYWSLLVHGRQPGSAIG